MKCPSCGAGELIHDTRDIPCAYKGQYGTIAAVIGEFCPACGEVVLDREEGDRFSARVGTFHRQVDADGPARQA